MKKTVTIAFIVLMMTLPFMAGARNVDTVSARKIAERFLSAKGVRSELHNITPAAWNGTLYLYSIGQKGFVLMSADDAVRPILAYSTEGDFPTDNIPPQVQAFIQPYFDIVEYARQHNFTQHPEWEKLLSGNAFQPKTRSSVGPLVTARWGQYYYYNRLCPIYPTSGNNCLTGCVATAMAQIMHYWKWPEHGWGQHEYLWFNENVVPMDSLSEQFDTVHYQWNLMLDEYDSLSTDAEIYAVSRLMYDCGVAVNMSYSFLESGAIIWSDWDASSVTAGQALRTYFRYNPMLRGVKRFDYSDSEWMGMMLAEFDAGRPVLYCAAEVTLGAHALVVDGYDEDHRIHFNFGWSGNYDGYYALDSIYASVDGQQGIHFTSQSQSAVIGIQPNFVESDPAIIQAVAEDTLVGYCTGGGQYAYADSVSLTAHTAEGYRFNGWSSGVFDNPHYFPATINFSDTAHICQLNIDSLYYCTPFVNPFWNSSNTGSFTKWGMRIPVGSLHGERELLAVQYYKNDFWGNNVKLNILSGDHPDESVTLYEHTYSTPEVPKGWFTFSIDHPVIIDTTHDLWIIFEIDGEMFNWMQYARSTYGGNSDGCWFYNETGWNTLDNVGIWSTWMIRALTGPITVPTDTGNENNKDVHDDVAFMAYPNPFQRQVFIKVKNPISEIQQCFLSDLTGRSEEVQLTAIDDCLYSLDLAARPQAVYLLTIVTEDGRRHTLRLIKQ